MRLPCYGRAGQTGDGPNVDMDAHLRLARLNRACRPHGSRPRQIAEGLVLDRVRRRSIGASGAPHSRRSKTSRAGELGTSQIQLGTLGQDGQRPAQQSIDGERETPPTEAASPPPDSSQWFRTDREQMTLVLPNKVYEQVGATSRLSRTN